MELPGGREWREYTAKERVYYVAGFMQGYAFGFRDGSAAILVQYPERLKSLPPAERKDTEDAAAEGSNVGNGFLSTVPSSLAASVTQFYSDKRNTTVCTDKAIMLVAASLVGNVPSEEELNAAREAGAERGCR